MSSKFQLSAMCAVALVSGPASASDTLGEFSTHASDDGLLLEGGRVLCCDLFFNAPGKESVTAPKGSELKQALPPVVWQYAGLLPVSDYVKSAVIHTVSSELQDRSWQDVQYTFHDGLLVEGAHDIDAKIAYAGAYAFAPRWSLVQLVEVEEAEEAYPGTIFFEVEYTKAPRQGMSVESYRALSLQIFQQPDEISLEDIKAIVDASDDIETKSFELASLDGIGGADSNGNPTDAGNEAPAANATNLEDIKPAATEAAGSSSSTVVGGNSAFVSNIAQQAVVATGNNASNQQGESSVKQAAGESVSKQLDSESSEAKNSAEGEGPASGANESASDEDQEGDEDSEGEADECVTEEGESEDGEDKCDAEEGETSSEEGEAAADAGEPGGSENQPDDKKAASSSEAVASGETRASLATANPTTSGLFGVETAKAPDTDSQSNSNPETTKVADRATEDTVAESEEVDVANQAAEIVKLPAGELFTSDKPLVTTELQPDIVSSERYEFQGNPIDLTVIKNSDSQEQVIAESDVIEQAEDATAEVSGPVDEWVVMPDGSLILQSVRKLYEDLIR